MLYQLLFLLLFSFFICFTTQSYFVFNIVILHKRFIDRNIIAVPEIFESTRLYEKICFYKKKFFQNMFIKKVFFRICFSRQLPTKQLNILKRNDSYKKNIRKFTHVQEKHIFIDKKHIFFWYVFYVFLQKICLSIWTSFGGKICSRLGYV